MRRPEQTLGRAASAIFLVALVVYATAISQIYGSSCGDRGPWLSAAGISIWAAVFASGIVAARAVIVKSLRSFGLLALAVLAAVIMYNLLLITALPGCSGV